MSYQPQDQDLTKLQQYTACDISDALLKLKVPGAGFVADLNLYSPPEGDGVSVTVAPVSTVLFAPKGRDLAEPQRNIPEGTHWVDLTEPGTIVVLKQPDGQKNAVCGGIMAIRMKVCQAKGVVVAGRVRDIQELKSTSLPIWARGLSTIGVGGGSVPWAIQVPLDIDGTLVCPGDLAFSDPINGVVFIPKDKVASVIELLPKLTTADDKVKEDVLGGSTVYESFKLHRIRTGLAFESCPHILIFARGGGFVKPEIKSGHLNLWRRFDWFLLTTSGFLWRSPSVRGRAVSHVLDTPAILNCRPDPSPKTIVDTAIELLFTQAHTAAHTTLPSRNTKLRAKAVALLDCRRTGQNGIHEVKVRSKVVGRVPFNSAHIWCSRDWWTFLGEMPKHVAVGTNGEIGAWGAVRGKGYDVDIMKEDPEHLFSDTDDLLIPNAKQRANRGVDLPPLNFHDAVEKIYNLLHAPLLDKVFDPCYSFVPQKQAKLVNLANLNKLWLLNLSKVCDVIARPLAEFDLGEDAGVGDGTSGRSFTNNTVCGFAPEMATKSPFAF
ncbi:hypothetical protein HG531_010120 [Fusarium graminearum]|nr:hypothetical protein HG531_010120 [Fusarium graminearum]